MSFSTSSTDIYLDGPVLHARCLNAQGNYVPSSLDLNTILGNDDGKFSWSMYNFSSSASGIELDGAILRANLKTRSGRPVQATVNLNLGIQNVDGQMTVGDMKLVTNVVGAEGYNIQTLDPDTGVISAFCVGTDGQLHLSSLDLNDYVGNRGGMLVSSGDHFMFSGRNARLDGQFLCADLKNYNNRWVPARMDLQKYLCNKEGVLTFEARDKFVQHTNRRKIGW